MDTVQRVTGKTGDLLGDDQIKQAGFAVLDHPMEVLPLFGRHTGQAFVNVAVHKGPCIVALNEITIVSDLVVQGIELLIAFAGYTGVKSNAQRDVVNRAGLHLLADRMYVHGRPLLKIRYIMISIS